MISSCFPSTNWSVRHERSKMMDNISTAERSAVMAKVRSKNTNPEVYFRKLLFKHGYRYSLHPDSVPGHPDIWLRKYHTAIFIHGCFWHRHLGCSLTRTPKSNVDFWEIKFKKNIERDERTRESLAHKNIKCLVVWECTIKRMKKDQSFQQLVLDKVIKFLNNQQLYDEL